MLVKRKVVELGMTMMGAPLEVEEGVMTALGLVLLMVMMMVPAMFAPLEVLQWDVVYGALVVVLVTEGVLAVEVLDAPLEALQ